MRHPLTMHNRAAQVDDEVSRYNSVLARFLAAEEAEWEAVVATYRGDLQVGSRGGFGARFDQGLTRALTRDLTGGLTGCPPTGLTRGLPAGWTRALTRGLTRGLTTSRGQRGWLASSTSALTSRSPRRVAGLGRGSFQATAVVVPS